MKEKKQKETYICEICHKTKKVQFFSLGKVTTRDNHTICGSCGFDIGVHISKSFDDKTYDENARAQIRKTYDRLLQSQEISSNAYRSSFSFEQLKKLSVASSTEISKIINSVSGINIHPLEKEEVYYFTDKWHINYYTKKVCMNGEFAYADILSYEYIEDGDIIKKGSSGLAGALIGGALFGGVGATVGGIVTKNKRVSSEITKAKLVINIKQGDNITSRTITYIDEPVISIEKGSSRYISKYNQAVQDMNQLDAIMKMADQEAENIKNRDMKQFVQSVQQIAESQNLPNQEKDSVTQIREFKKLFDEGIITQEEFDVKKKQLLGL